MGGRGAASGTSDKEKKYGTEFSSLHEVSNIKFVRFNESKSAKSPQETITMGRIYVTINKNDTPVSITYFDNSGKRNKTIDLTHSHDGKQPHVHHGYEHSEYGTTGLSVKERKMVDFITKIWNNKIANSSIG